MLKSYAFFHRVQLQNLKQLLCTYRIYRYEGQDKAVVRNGRSTRFFDCVTAQEQTIFFRRYLSSLFFLVSFFMLYEKLSIFKFFLKMVTFFQKKPKFEQLTCLTLDSFIFRSLKDFIFLSKKKIGNIYWSMELANIKHWKFELCIS